MNKLVNYRLTPIFLKKCYQHTKSIFKRFGILNIQAHLLYLKY